MDLVWKYKMLYRIAEEDSVYQMWRKSCEDITPAFDAFVGAQPQDVQMLLLGYMEAWRMMQQKLVSLACEHMEFPGDISPAASQNAGSSEPWRAQGI